MPLNCFAEEIGRLPPRGTVEERSVHMKQERVTSVSEYIECVMKKRREAFAQKTGAAMWFFRGQKCDQWAVVPSAFRGDGLAAEHDVLKDAIRRSPAEFRGLSEFEILAKLQHYGLGTRLLDVTLNPLVALYFACEPHVEYLRASSGQYTQQRHDGAVYFGHRPRRAADLATTIASAIPFVAFDRALTVEDFLTELAERRLITVRQRNCLAADNYSAFLRCVQGSCFARSSQSNERLVRQSGAFLIPAALNVVGRCDDVGRRLVEKTNCTLDGQFLGRICIPEACKAGIRSELELFNVNEAAMFPELEHQMVYIRNSCRAANAH